MRIAFFGNSEFSLRVLKKLSNHSVFVVTAPDKPFGRGRVSHPNIIKQFCIGNNLRFVHDDSWDVVMEKLRKHRPDFMIVASYGRIIPKEVLEILDRTRRLNVHPSLLPRWRGPAPIQWSILSGDEVTGVSVCLVDEKVDSGDILFQKEEVIRDEDNFLTLGRLFDIAADVLPELMGDIVRDKVTFKKQDESSSTWARLIRKEDGFFSFNESADVIHRKMRAFLVWPKIYTFIRGERVIVHKTELVRDPRIRGSRRAGDIISVDEKGICVACGEDERGGAIVLSLLQREGRNVLRGKDFANGMRLKPGDNILDYA